MGLDHNVELGEFLRTRRARLGPEQAGLSVNGTARRVPGLRREELAQLAGVSTDYYARLEQGRHRNVSGSVLDSVARALRLDEVEHSYLVRLARPQSGAARRVSARPQRVRPGLHRMLETLDGWTPAFVVGRGLQVLAANRLARALITDFEALPYRERNMARFIFLDESARQLYPDWERIATETAAVLRLDAGQHCEDRNFCELIGELAVKSEQFRLGWAAHDVSRRSHGSKRYRHPQVGEITVAYEALTPPGDADQTLFVYTTEPGSPSETALQLLANLTAPSPAAPRPALGGTDDLDDSLETHAR
ncbi:helix-turn-helix transcriptional regulator [Kitasatospora sp. NPDC057223]|uniref:helix-turn-helix transcriptional regulator n=1 Tax=Kitasatospora sp. NPDC057223 TaxID=3346055 RepID=UPI00362C048B